MGARGNESVHTGNVADGGRGNLLNHHKGPDPISSWEKAS